MAFYDIFNGDADGICALHQLRLADPCDARLITGVKREIDLVSRCSATAAVESRRAASIMRKDSSAGNAR